MYNRILTKIFTNKKILFYGPANTTDKDFINLNDFDFIILTNNMINIFFYKYRFITKPKIVLLTNGIYTNNNIKTILKWDHRISLYITCSDSSMDKLTRSIRHKLIFNIKNNIYGSVKGKPLGLTRFLIIINNINFKFLFISGITFYSNNNLLSNYEKGYTTNETKKYNIFTGDAKQHDIVSNIIYTLYFIKGHRGNINICNELKNILLRFL